MRQRHRLAVSVCAFWAFFFSPAFGDNPIVTKHTPKVAAPIHELTFGQHEKIELVAKYVIPEGFEANHTWSIEGAASTVYDSGRVLAVWAAPGKYKATFEAWLINWEAREQKHIKEHFHLVVQGPRPPPDPDDPDPDPDPTVKTEGPVFSLVLRNAEDLTAEQSQALSAIRDWVDEQPATEVQHQELDIDAVGPDGKTEPRVAKYTEAIPDTSSLPYGFISKKKVGGGAVILWAGELVDADETIELLERFSKE
tara:strand:+ start:959 stop:1717 length:759 start_codon:yes stop_codon:yes gene_type:complete